MTLKTRNSHFWQKPFECVNWDIKVYWISPASLWPQLSPPLLLNYPGNWILRFLSTLKSLKSSILRVLIMEHYWRIWNLSKPHAGIRIIGAVFVEFDPLSKGNKVRLYFDCKFWNCMKFNCKVVHPSVESIMRILADRKSPPIFVISLHMSNNLRFNSPKIERKFWEESVWNNHLDKQSTLWILALKWYRQNMSLEKIYFTLLMKTKIGKKEFLKSYIVLLRAELNCTVYAGQMGQLAGAS